MKDAEDTVATSSSSFPKEDQNNEKHDLDNDNDETGEDGDSDNEGDKPADTTSAIAELVKVVLNPITD